MKIIFYLFGFLMIVGCETEKFTTAKGNVHEVASLVGMDVFDVANEFSEYSPETLTGTNNERWVIYYKDIDVTLETNKSTNIVVEAKKGRKPKESTWAK